MRTTTIILIILATAFNCNSQDIRCAVDKSVHGIEIYSFDPGLTGPDKRSWIIVIENVLDSTSMQLKLNYDHIKVYGDTIKALIGVLKWFNENQDRLKQTSDELYEAENVLRWLRTDGFVTNWKEFRKATDRYIKIRDYKAVMKKP